MYSTDLLDFKGTHCIQNVNKVLFVDKRTRKGTFKTKNCPKALKKKEDNISSILIGRKMLHGGQFCCSMSIITFHTSGTFG